MRMTTNHVSSTVLGTVIDIICFQIHSNPWVVIPILQIKLKHRENAVQGHTGRSWSCFTTQVLTHHTQNTFCVLTVFLLLPLFLWRRCGFYFERGQNGLPWSWWRIIHFKFTNIPNKVVKTFLKPNTIYNKEKIYPQGFWALIRFCLNYSVQSHLYKVKFSKLIYY